MPQDVRVENTVIDIQGPPAAMGLAHGRTLAPRIQHSLTEWRRAMSGAGQDPDELIDALSRTSGFVDAVEQHTPWLLAEIEGIADGAGLRVEEVFALNCLDEAWWWGEQSAGCSTLGISWPTEQRAVCGQNMDLDTWMDGGQVVVRAAPTARPAYIALSRAGMIGLCGVNDQGVAILVNTLPQLPVSKTGVPVAFAMRAALGGRSVDEAAQILRGLPHASGQAYTLVSRDKVLGLESGATGTAEYVNTGSADRRWHTNHPLASSIGAAEPDSKERLQALDDDVSGIQHLDDVQRLLSDGDRGVCMYPGRWPGNWMTFGSISVELADEVRAHFTFGPPDRNPWFDVTF